MPLAEDKFVRICIFVNKFSKAQRAKFRKYVKRNKIGPQANITRPYMTDDEVMAGLEQHGNHGFDKLPRWLRQELKVRRIQWPTREPTDLEAWETVSDAREHRIMNKELTIKDYQDKYIRNKPLTIT